MAAARIRSSLNVRMVRSRVNLEFLIANRRRSNRVLQRARVSIAAHRVIARFWVVDSDWEPDRPPASCPYSVQRHRHNAAYQHSEATIHYRFHPWAGVTLPVIGRNVHRGVRVLTVRLPHGAALSIPEWMTRPEAAAFGLRSSPVLPARTLQHLRTTLDILLSSPSDESSRGGSYGATTCLQSTDSDPAEATRHSATGEGAKPSRAVDTKSIVGDCVQRNHAQVRGGERQ
jgi:hypothetical protein